MSPYMSAEFRDRADSAMCQFDTPDYARAKRAPQRDAIMDFTTRA